MKKYIVIAVDIGETVDGHSSMLGVFDTMEKAKEYVREDMKDIAHSYGGCIVLDDEMEVWTDENKTEGCVWDIFEV